MPSYSSQQNDIVESRKKDRDDHAHNVTKAIWSRERKTHYFENICVARDA